MSKNDTIHIGQLVRQEVHDRGIRVSWFAEQLHCHRNNIYKIYEKPWIDTQMLLQISLILHHDFFNDLSNYYQQTQKVEV